MVRLAAQLAWEGHLPSVKDMWLWDIDLSDIPRDQIGKLASIVTTGCVIINNISPATHLDIILKNVRSELHLHNMSLTEPQTRTLVTAMRDRVERVELWHGITLDIDTFCQYNGRGRCWVLVVYGDMRERYGQRLRQCMEVDWAVIIDDDAFGLNMKRK